MHTVLCTVAGRVALALTFAVGTTVALTAPAGASGHPSHRGDQPVHAARGHVGHGVEIGSAEKYVVTADGAVVRVR